MGIITARLENNLVKLQIENDRTTTLDSKSSIVGLGTTSAGIGTHRFLSEGQPPGAERSVRFGIYIQSSNWFRYYIRNY